MLVKSLVALATEKMLLKTSGKTFLKGIAFMYAAGLAPERLSVMMTSSHKYILQFHSKCDIRPFAANYPTFARVLRGIVHVRAWRIKSIEFVNVAFDVKDVDNLERTIDKLGVELVLLRNCSYPNVTPGDQAVALLNALNRKKQAVVCEYGEDRLKHMIAKRSRHDRAAEVPPALAGPGDMNPDPHNDGQGPAFVQALRRRYPYHLRRRNVPHRLEQMAGDIIYQALQHYPGVNPSNIWAHLGAPPPAQAAVAAVVAGQMGVPPPAQHLEAAAAPMGEQDADTADERQAPVPENLEGAAQQQDIEMQEAFDRPPFYRVGDEPEDDFEEVELPA